MRQGSARTRASLAGSVSCHWHPDVVFLITLIKSTKELRNRSYALLMKNRVIRKSRLCPTKKE